MKKLLLIFLLIGLSNSYINAQTNMEFNGIKTVANGVTFTFSTGGLFTLYANHPYATPMNGGNDFADINLSQTVYINSIEIAWATNVQAAKIQFFNGGTLTKELSSFSIATYAVNASANKIRVVDQDGSSSGGLEISHVNFNTTTLTTTSISIFDATSATMGGEITFDGGATITERGVVYSSTDCSPQIGETGVTKDTNGSGTGNFSELITGLDANTTYYVRAFATNIFETSYGGVQSFTTTAVAVAPTAITNAASSITASGATLNGSINANSASTAVTFEYGLTTGYGSTVTAIQSPVTGSSAISVSKAISGLAASTNYHYRVKGVNSGGTTYGSDLTFTTSIAAPTVSSVSVPSNGTYIASQNLDFTVNYGEAITITGTPYIQIALNTGTVNASYVSGSGTTALVFRYTVVAGNLDGDGVSVGSTISANGGTLKNSIGTDAILTLNSVGSTTGVLVDAVAPTATIVVADNSLILGETSLVTITFSEAVTGFTNDDLTIANGTLTAVSSSNGGITWTATFTPTASITVATNVIKIDKTGIADAAGNAGSGTTNSNSYAIDTVRPTLASAFTISDTALKIGETATVTFIFTEAVTGFTTADLTVPNGVVSSLSSSDGGITWTAILTPNATTTDGSNLITLGYTGINDLAGNAGTGSATSGNYAIDTARPTVAIVVADNALRIGETSLVTFTFSEAVTGFSNADLTIANGTLTAVSSSDGGMTWTATFTPTASITDATNLITLDDTGVTDAAGNAGSGTTDSNNYAIDTARPTVAIVVADNALRIGETSLVTFTFSESVTGFTNADLSIANGTLTAVSSSNGGITWTATFTPTASITDATNVITLYNTGVTDAAGNAGSGTTDSNNYAIDTARPTATIVVADNSLIVGETSLVTFTFSKAVTGFTNADLTIANGTLTAVSSSDGGITWTATFTPTASITDATNVITLDNTGVTDAAGNAGSGTTDSNNYAIDTARPTATIVVADNSLIVGETSLVTFTFSEAVTGFTNADLTIANGTLTAVSSSDGGITWTATFTPTASITDATNVITLDNSGVTDAAGNAGSGTTDSNNYAIDTARPTVAIVVADNALRIGEASLVTFTFSEAVTGFTNADLTIANGTLTAVSSSDGGITWTATFTPTASISDATNVITLDNTGVTDAAGNAGSGTTDSNNYAIDTARPTATIVVADNSLIVGETSLVTFTFSEAVTGFTNADLTVANGALTAVSSSDGGITWTATFTPTASITDATNVITFDNTGVTDAAGNAGSGTTDSNNYAIDTTRPTLPDVTSSNANGTYKKNDVIAILVTFSEAVTVTGTPTLALNSGGTVSYSSGSATTVLTFSYTVGSGESSADLDYIATNSLVLVGGTIKDAAGNDATLTLPTVGGASSLGGQKNILIAINPSSGGTIATNQAGCYPFDPTEITNSVLPSGHIGTLEYKWQSSTTSSSAGFIDIAASNAATYDPGSLTVNTWYRRLSRVDCMSDWTGAAESNAVKMTVNVLPSSSTSGPNSYTYNGTAYTASSIVGGGENVYWYAAATGVTTASAPTGTNVGTYSAYAEAKNTTTGCVSASRTLIALEITKAILTVSADNETKVYGDENPILTFQYSGWKNSETESVLDIKPTASTAVDLLTNVGTYTNSITVSGGTDNNYAFSYEAANFTVTQAMLTTTADAKTKVYGDANPNLTFQYSGWKNNENEAVLDTKPTVSSTVNRLSNAGNHTNAITVSGGVDNNYYFSYVAANFTVTQVTLTLTADAKTKVYGDPNPTLTFHYSGWINSETELVLDTKPTISTTVDLLSNVGSHTNAITISGGADNNYAFSYESANFTVTQATLTTTADAKTKVYGDATPSLTFHYSGWKNSETESVLETKPSASTTVNLLSNAGMHTNAIIVAGGTDNNYAFSYVAANFMVVQATLAVTADAKTKVYGDANPTLTFHYSGWKNSETETVLDTKPTTSTTVNLLTNVGVHTNAITVSGGADNNYAFNYVAANFTITKATLTATAEAKTKVYGEANPILTFKYGGWKNSETESVLDTKPIASTTVNLTTPVGTHPNAIIISGGVDGNYDFLYVSSDFEITKAPLTISAEAQNKVYDGTTSATVTGAKLIGVLNGNVVSLTLGSTTFDNKNAGNNKDVTVTGSLISGAGAGNYTLKEVSGLKANITPKQLTITNTSVLSNKMVDNSTAAKVENAGTLQGLISADANSVAISAIATYNDAAVGNDKVITTVFTISGSASNNYIKPSDLIMNGAKISDMVSLSETLEVPVMGECQGEDLFIGYQIKNGTPTDYRITFSASALAAGFVNTGYLPLPSTQSQDRLFIQVPANMVEGVYTANLQFRNELNIESPVYIFQFTIKLSKNYILKKFGDVILCDNSSNRFTAYQWYKNGQLIPGATCQFYNDKSGLDGFYSLQVITKEGAVFRSCDQEIHTPKLKNATISAYPNPARSSETFTVKVTDINDQDLNGAVMRIYNVLGALVQTINDVKKVNSVKLPLGEYIGTVITSDQRRLTYKITIVNF